MDSHLSEESLWASGLSSRLRLIQANFADDPSSVRQGYIIEEIERALKPVSPTKRSLFLDSLKKRFPDWEGVRTAARSDTKFGTAPLTPEELVARLVEMAPTLSPEARAAFSTQLQAVGLSIKESADSLMLSPTACNWVENAARASGESVGAISTSRATSSSGVNGAVPNFVSLRAAVRTPSQSGNRFLRESRKRLLLVGETGLRARSISSIMYPCLTEEGSSAKLA